MARGRGRGRIGGAGSYARAGGAAGRGRDRGRGGGGNSVGQFLAPHTGRQAGHLANAQAGTEYNAGIRQTREEAKGSRKRQADLGSWYAQLASDYQGAQNQGAAALQSVENTTSQQLAEAGQRSSADQAALGASDEAFAKLVGGPKDTAGLAKIAQAGQAAATARVDQAKLPISEQANFTARLGSDTAAARLKGIESRQEEARRRDKLKSDLAAQRKEKGQARVSNTEKIREADRSYSMEQRQFRQQKREAAIQAKQAAASQRLAEVEGARGAQQAAVQAMREVREGKISARQAQEKIAISRRNAKTSEASNRGGLTPTQRRAANRQHKNATTTAANLYKAAEKPPKSASEWAAFTQLVAGEEGIDATAAAAAVAKLKKALAYKKRKTPKSIIGTVMHPGTVEG